jgi:hypothetical protein
MGSSNEVNLQYGHYAWENWQAKQYATNGYYCIQNVQFGRYLSFNAAGCSTFQGAGCGSVTSATSCGQNEQFMVVQNANDATKFGLRSVANPHAFLRLDGSGITSELGSGGGVVNGQYYSNNQAPDNYELVQMKSTGNC